MAYLEDALFQVTKRGLSVRLAVRCEVLRPIPTGVKGVSAESNEEAGVDDAREVDELVEGVEIAGRVVDDKAGALDLEDLYADLSVFLAILSFWSSSLASSSLASRPLG